MPDRRFRQDDTGIARCTCGAWTWLRPGERSQHAPAQCRHHEAPEGALGAEVTA